MPRLQQIPGVEAAGVVTYLPLSGWSGGVDFTIEGRPQETGAEQPSERFQTATRGLLPQHGHPPGQPAARSRRATMNRAPRVVVDQRGAGARSTGRVRTRSDGGCCVTGRSGPVPFEIVGIVNDVRSAGLEEPVERRDVLLVWQAESGLPFWASPCATQVGPGVSLAAQCEPPSGASIPINR